MTIEQKICMLITKKNYISALSLINECNIKQLHKESNKHKILSEVTEFVKNITDSQNIKDNVFIDNIVQQQNDLQQLLLTLSDINAQFNDDAYMIIKGMALSQLLYDNIAKRPGADIDIVVPEKVLLSIVEDLVYTHGYTLLEIDDLDHAFRYTVNSHEVQLRSPFGSYVEIKRSSSAIFSFDLTRRDIIDDFMEHRQIINMNGLSIMTSDMCHTLLHIILNIFTNTYTYCSMGNARLRDYLDLYAFNEKYPDYFDELYIVASRLNIAYVVSIVLKETNELFDTLFDKTLIERFNTALDYRNEIEMLKEFDKLYQISIFDKLFEPHKKARNYYKALSGLYYSDMVYTPDRFPLNQEMLAHYILMEGNQIQISLIINLSNLNHEKAHKVEIWALNYKETTNVDDDFYTFLSTTFYQESVTTRMSNDPTEYLLDMPIPRNMYTTYLNNDTTLDENGNLMVSYSFDRSKLFGTVCKTSKLCYRIYLSEIQASGERLHLYDPHPISSGVCLLDTVVFSEPKTDCTIPLSVYLL